MPGGGRRTGLARSNTNGNPMQDTPATPPQQSKFKGRLYQWLGVAGGLVWAFVCFAIWEEAEGFAKAAIGLVGIFGVIGFMLLFDTGKRHLLPDADKVMDEDPRPPVIYLRSFDDDDTPVDLEWALADIMETVGPFVAIGRPGDKIPPLGASRSYVADKDWQGFVIKLLDRSALVVLLAGKTEGLHWELGQCGRRIQPSRLVVLVPKDKDVYETFRTNVQKSGIRIELPPFPNRDVARFGAGDLCGLVHFDDRWQGTFVPFRRAFFKGASHEMGDQFDARHGTLASRLSAGCRQGRSCH